MCRNQIFLIFANKLRSKENLKNHTLHFVDMVSRKRLRSLSKKYWTVGKLQLVKIFKCLDKIPGFSKTIELCLNFSMGFCIN